MMCFGTSWTRITPVRAMFDQLGIYADSLTAMQVILGTGSLALALIIVRSRQGLALFIGLFVVSICFATAGDLRFELPLISVLPALFATLLAGYLVCTRGRTMVSLPLAAGWMVLTLYFTVRGVFSTIGALSLYWNLYYFVILVLGLSLGMLMATPPYRLPIARGLLLGSTAVLAIRFSPILQAYLRSFTQDRLTPWGIQANIWGPTSLVAVINALLCFQIDKSAAKRWWQLTVLALGTASLILSFSRGSIIALVAGILVYLLVATGRRFKTTILAIALAGGVVAAICWAGENGLIDLGASERLLSLRSESRETLMADLYHEYVARDPVWGNGFLQKEGSLEIGRGDPHNSFLLLWIEQGTVGLALVLFLVIGSFRVALRDRRRWPARSPERALANHALAAFSAMLVDGMTVPHLWTHHTILGFDFALRVGVIAGLAARREVVPRGMPMRVPCPPPRRAEHHGSGPARMGTGDREVLPRLTSRRRHDTRRVAGLR